MNATQYPRLKMATALLRGGGELHLVGSAEITSIHDPFGAIQHLVRLADGTRSAAQITALLLAGYPQLHADDVADALHALDDAGVLEDYPLGIRSASFSGS